MDRLTRKSIVFLAKCIIKAITKDRLDTDEDNILCDLSDGNFYSLDDEE